MSCSGKTDLKYSKVISNFAQAVSPGHEAWQLEWERGLLCQQPLGCAFHPSRLPEPSQLRVAGLAPGRPAEPKPCSFLSVLCVIGHGGTQGEASPPLAAELAEGGLVPQEKRQKITV